MEIDTPDPYATADAQQGLNTQTAANQNIINQTNQVTPDYTLTYRKTGQKELDGGRKVPNYTAFTELSPANQKIYDTQQGTKQNLATIGNEQSAAVRNILNTPFNFDDASESKYEQMARSRLDPLWDQRAGQFEQDAVNRGIRPGSAAYSALSRDFGQQRNDAYNSLYVQGKGLFDQEALTERNQPLNEISALMSGSQIQQPNFINTPQSQMASTNLAGMVYDSAAMKNQQQGAMMGGLFGLGGSLLRGGIGLMG